MPACGVVELRHLFLFDQPRLADFGPDLVAGLPRLRAVGAAVVVEFDVKAGEVGLVGLLHLADNLFLGNALLPSADHDGGAVGVVGTDEDAPPPTESLEPHPNVGLQVLDEVSDVNMAVGVGQGAGDEDLPHIRGSGSSPQSGHSTAQGVLVQGFAELVTA